MRLTEFELQRLENAARCTNELLDRLNTNLWNNSHPDFFENVELLIQDYRAIMETEHGREINPNFFNKV